MTYTTIDFTRFTTTLSQDIIDMVEEFQCSQTGLDPVVTEEALLHEAIHAYTGLGVTLDDEAHVYGCINILIGQCALPAMQERCELLVSIIPVEVLAELVDAFARYYK